MAERKLKKKAMKERIRAKKLESVFKASPKPVGRGNVPPTKEISKIVKTRIVEQKARRNKIAIYNNKKEVQANKAYEKLCKANAKKLVEEVKAYADREAKARDRELEGILARIEALAPPSLSFGAKPMDENKLEKILFVESDVA